MKRKINILAGILMLAAFLSVENAVADIKLPRLISNGMVLQRDKPLKIWGWAESGENVTVAFNNKTYTAKADSKGNWAIEMPAMPAGGPYEMKLSGNNEITIKNILIGEVWIGSGQSNMETPISRVHVIYPGLIENSANTFIRQFIASADFHFEKPRQDLQSGEWMEANPTNIGGFSAVAYFFAKELHEKLNVPVGVIRIAVGGSPIEAWLSEDVTKKYPENYALYLKYQDARIVDSIQRHFNTIASNWTKQLNSGDRGIHESVKWFDSSYDFADWKTYSIPGVWNRTNNPFVQHAISAGDAAAGKVSPKQYVSGVAWFKKEIDLTDKHMQEDALLILGTLIDRDEVYFNGTQVGSTGYQYPPRRYRVPRELIKPGKNVITIRLSTVNEQGGFVEKKEYLFTNFTDTVNLEGPWKFSVGTVSEREPGGQINFRNQPVGLYNGMVAPTLNYANRGVIWYQGESNAHNPKAYEGFLSDLVNDWRQKYNNPKMPFLLVQLPNFMKPTTDANENSQWSEMREVQRRALRLENTGLAVTIDIGEENDIHPLNKKDVGHRLVLLARHLVYGDKNVVPYGPLLDNHKVSGNQFILSFKTFGSQLRTRNGEPLKGFAVAGSDKKYVWADAKIEGDKIIVSSQDVDKPVYLRYAWGNNPVDANLVNEENIPASPFTIQ